MRLTGPRRERAVLIVLAIASGILDAVSYLGLGHVFTANMTGNTVLLGVAIAVRNGHDAARAATALGGYCIGVAVGTALLSRSRARWPAPAVGALGLATAALAAILAAWAAVGVAPIRYALIVVSAIAMGAQSAAVRVAHPSGVKTTYVTGTLTNAVARLVMRFKGVAHTRDPTLPGEVWVTYGLGALAGALAEHGFQEWSLVPALAILAGVTLFAAVR